MRAANAIVIAACALVGMSVAVVWRARQGQRPPASRLSVFEPHAGGCAWYRHDVVRGDEREIARFPSDCATVQAAFDPRGKKALVWFSPEGFPSREDMLYEVDVAAQKPKRLPLPDGGEAQTYLYDEKGQAHAFTEDQQVTVEPTFPAVGTSTGDEDALDPAAPAAPGWIEEDGKRFRASSFPEGQDVLVRDLVLTPKGWQVEEIAASRCCAEGAPGLHALTTYERLTASVDQRERQSNAQLTAGAPFARVDAAPLLKAQAGRLPEGITPATGPWLRLASPSWPRALLAHGTSTEPSHATGVAFFVEAGQARAIPGFTFAPTDVVQPVERGPYLLVTDWGTGMDPHLYDMRTGQLVFSSQVAYATTFWPGD